MQSKELSRKQLVKMIAELRGMLYTVKNITNYYDCYDEQCEIEKVLEKTTFDVSDEDDWG